MAQWTNLTADYEVSKDEMTAMDVYRGQFGFDELKNGKTFGWFRDGVKEYKPDVEKIAYLEKNMGQYNLVIFLGTWCDDSHNLVPKLYKVLTAADYKGEYKMYGVDRDKTTKHDMQKVYGITLVPTIIVQKENMEIGRITETVKTSIESDLTDIIKKDHGQ